MTGPTNLQTHLNGYSAYEWARSVIFLPGFLWISWQWALIGPSRHGCWYIWQHRELWNCQSERDPWWEARGSFVSFIWNVQNNQVMEAKQNWLPSVDGKTQRGMQASDYGPNFQLMNLFLHEWNLITHCVFTELHLLFFGVGVMENWMGDTLSYH